MQIEILKKEEMFSLIKKLNLNDDILFVLVMGGDRLNCCDEFVVLQDKKQVVALVSISFLGEAGDGEVTIVGVYVCPQFRGRKYSRMVFEAALQRCITHGFRKVRVDVNSVKIARVIYTLDPHLKKYVDAHDMGVYPMDILALL